MPSSQTTNYQLNQWAKSDQVRMEDFNADNAKIDAALAGLEGARRSDLLGIYAFPADGAALNISLTGFGLTKYVSLEVRLSRLTATGSVNVRYALNGLSNIYYNTRNGSTAIDYPGYVSLDDVGGGVYRGGGVMLVHLDGAALGGQCWKVYASSGSFAYPYIDDWGVRSGRLAPSQLTSIVLSPSGPLTGGKVFLVGNRF